MVILLVQACGNKSQIKTTVAPVRTAQAYGDGELTKIPLILPLSEDTISGFDSPLAKAGFLVGGIARLFLDTGAIIGLGKAELTLNQPVPELPKDVLKSVSVKRVFFFIEPKKGKREKDIVDRFLFGERSADFNFLDRFILRVNPSSFDTIKNWYPMVETKMSSSLFLEKMTNLLSQKKQVQDELVLINYDRKRLETHSKVSQFLLLSGANLIELRDFIKSISPETMFRRTQILGKTLVLEIDENLYSVDDFKILVDAYSSHLREVGLKNIEQCHPSICVDFKVQQNNLIDLVKTSNGIKINTYFDVGELPDSFLIKGFIEVDTELKLTF